MSKATKSLKANTIMLRLFSNASNEQSYEELFQCCDEDVMQTAICCKGNM